MKMEVHKSCKKQNNFYEGKAKKVFKTEEPEVLIVSYKDDATAFNGLKKEPLSARSYQQQNE